MGRQENGWKQSCIKAHQKPPALARPDSYLLLGNSVEGPDVSISLARACCCVCSLRARVGIRARSEHDSQALCSDLARPLGVFWENICWFLARVALCPWPELSVTGGRNLSRKHHTIQMVLISVNLQRSYGNWNLVSVFFRTGEGWKKQIRIQEKFWFSRFYALSHYLMSIIFVPFLLFIPRYSLPCVHPFLVSSIVPLFFYPFFSFFIMFLFLPFFCPPYWLS